MKQKIKIYAIPLFLVMLSIVLQILSETKVLDSIIGSLFVEDKAENVKTVITIIGYIAFVVPLGWQSVTRGKKAYVCDATISKYIDEQREVLINILRDQKYVNGTTEDINLRVFKKRLNRLVLENEDNFYSKRIDGKLSFSIAKKEGLCAKAYTHGRSMLEIEDASKPEYNLTERQKALAGGLKFIVAVPIHLDKNGKIKYVICFDSFQKIAKPGYEQGILKSCETIAYTVSAMIQ